MPQHERTVWEALGSYHGPRSFKVFVRYLTAICLREAEDMIYRAYVTDQLRLIPQMMYLSDRWHDVVTGSVKVDSRSAEEIADDVVSRLEGLQ